MKWLYNLSIQTKLIAAFLVVGLFVAGAGFIDYRATATMAENAERMYNRQFVPLSHLLRLTDNFQRTRVYAQNFLLITDSAEVRKMKRTVAGIYGRFDSVTAMYKANIDTESEMRSYQTFIDSLAFFRTTFDEIVRLAETGRRLSLIRKNEWTGRFRA